MSRQMHGIVQRLDALSQPIVVVVNGYALGGGAELAVAGDITVIEDHGFLCFKQAQMGLITGWGGAARIARRIGYSKAYEILATGCRIEPQAAFELGLVNHVAPTGKGIQYALDFFDSARASSPRALAAIKRLFRAAQTQPDAKTDELEEALFETVWNSTEHTKAVEAFMTSRRDATP